MENLSEKDYLKDLEEKFDKATNFSEKGEYSKARKILKNLLTFSDDPGLKSDIYFMLGMNEDSAGNYKQAIKYLNDSLHLNVDDIEMRCDTYYYLGRCYLSEGEYPEAIDYLRKALDMKKLSAKEEIIAHCCLGECLYQIAKYDEAVTELSYLNKLSLDECREDTATFFYHLGISYYKIAKYAESIPYFEKTLNLRKDLREKRLLAWLAESYYQIKEYAKAINAFEEELEIASSEEDKAFAYRGLGHAFYALSMYEKAGEMYRLALFSHPAKKIVPDIYYGLGLVNVEEGRLQEGIEKFKVALKNKPVPRIERLCKREITEVNKLLK